MLTNPVESLNDNFSSLKPSQIVQTREKPKKTSHHPATCNAVANSSNIHESVGNEARWKSRWIALEVNNRHVSESQASKLYSKSFTKQREKPFCVPYLPDTANFLHTCSHRDFSCFSELINCEVLCWWTLLPGRCEEGGERLRMYCDEVCVDSEWNASSDWRHSL